MQANRMLLACLTFAVPLFALSRTAAAASTVDLGAGTLPRLLHVDEDNQPYYITTSGSVGRTGTVDTLRVGQGTRLHLGYGHLHPAAGDVSVKVGGDAMIEGDMRLGKKATVDAFGVPDAATGHNVSLSVAGDLTVAGGQLAATNAANDVGVGVHVGKTLLVNRGGSVRLEGASSIGMARLEANSVVLRDGSLHLEKFASLTTSDLRVAESGVLLLNGGTPPLDGSAWDYRGVEVSSAGGAVVASGGVLRAGSAGGFLKGSGQNLVVGRGGAVDASKGTLATEGFDRIDLGGSYLAGYNRVSGVVNRLEARTGGVDIRETASLGMSVDLQRTVNRLSAPGVGNAAILKADSIVFKNGAPPVLQTGMGVYTLAVGADPTPNAPGAALWVKNVERAVRGGGDAADRGLFRDNMENLWRPAGVSAAQAENVYNLSAAEIASIEAYGAAGRLNRQVLEAFVNGRNQSVADRGVADDGLFEMYNASPMFGLNTVAYNTAVEVADTVGRRLDEINAELDYAARIGSGEALAFFSYPEQYHNRVWIGGFGRDEEAELDYGISGYKYQPRGMAIGYDRMRGSFLFGGAATYGKGDYADRAASANASEIASYSASAYGAYYGNGGSRASVFAAYSRLDNDIDDARGGFRRRADHDSHAWSVGAAAGYDLCPADRLVLSPSVGVTHVRAVNEAHDETLDGVGVMRVGAVRRNSTLLPLDLGIRYDLYRGGVTLLRLTTNLGYAYDFDNDGATGDYEYTGLAGAVAMPVAERAPGCNRFNFGVGIIWSGSRLDFTAKYDYYRRADQDAHQVKGNFGVKF